MLSRRFAGVAFLIAVSLALWTESASTAVALQSEPPRNDSARPADGKRDESGEPRRRQRRQQPGDESPPAQPPAPGENPRLQRFAQMLRQFDSDGDGSIVLADLPDRVQTRFQRADRNGDGMLDRGELARVLRQLRDRTGGQPEMNNANRPRRTPRDGEGESDGMKWLERPVEPPSSNDEAKGMDGESNPEASRPPERRRDGGRDEPIERPGNGTVEPKRPGGG